MPIHLYTDISTLLTDAESADYGECEDDFFPHQRLYSTIGTCLFYKDTLVCNHLPDGLLKLVVGMCTYHWLLMLVKKERLNQLIFWKELFLQPFFDEDDDAEEDAEEEDKSCEFRWFLLVVGQGRTLFCTLLQAGGVSSVPEGNPGPHPFYVDTAWSILRYLVDILEVEVTCATNLEICSTPAIVAPPPLQMVNQRPSSRPLEQCARKISAGTEAYNRANSWAEDVDNATFDSTVSREGSISSSSNSNVFNSYFDRTSNKSNISLTTAISTKLTLGISNSLFAFTILQPHGGVLISPNFLPSDDPVTNDIITSFNQSCESIHAMFARNNNKNTELEHGLLFQVECPQGVDMKKGGWGSLRFWVVGRLVRGRGGSPRGAGGGDELYVCFEDGVPQNVIEMAYKVRFGCYY